MTFMVSASFGPLITLIATYPLAKTSQSEQKKTRKYKYLFHTYIIQVKAVL